MLFIAAPGHAYYMARDGHRIYLPTFIWDESSTGQDTSTWIMPGCIVTLCFCFFWGLFLFFPYGHSGCSIYLASLRTGAACLARCRCLVSTY